MYIISGVVHGKLFWNSDPKRGNVAGMGVAWFGIRKKPKEGPNPAEVKRPGTALTDWKVRRLNDHRGC